MEDKLVRISSEMARRTDVDGTVAKKVKGRRAMERQRLATPPRIVHRIEERMEKGLDGNPSQLGSPIWWT
uniref:Uncharacterized protein n=1 Tax=Romanomermis culicivorax TaxID=13658 RepID=A0A915JUK3_ROMCU